ncbi:MAG: hypothetical protein KDA44_15740 [Planctomycetales bacterium]|nr:hypothetical protein [Planctomycetales bacterium]
MPYLSAIRIKADLSGQARRIWSTKELLRYVGTNIEFWKCRKNTEGAIEVNHYLPTHALETIVDAGLVRKISIPFPHRPVTRYVYGEQSPYAVVQSSDRNGYFSHYSAMFLQDLTEQIPKVYYFNAEQRATGGGGTLTQASINRAFAGRCRVSSNFARFGDATVYKLNGQNTGCLGVKDLLLDGAEIRVTDIERTLIDIVVRPIYSGGIAEVAKAFEIAAPNVSVNRLTTYLKALNFTYPYHQVIGYYMDRAGKYSEKQLAQLRRISRDFDFYIDYQIKNPTLNKQWRLFVPKGF